MIVRRNILRLAVTIMFFAIAVNQLHVSMKSTYKQEDHEAAFLLSNRKVSLERRSHNSRILLNATNVEVMPSIANSTSSFCFKLNTREWLTARHSNSDDGIDMLFLRNMISSLPNLISTLGRDQPILKQTLCYDHSQFLNYSLEDDPSTVRMWSIRLIYLAVHYHQHIEALPEVDFLLRHPQCQSERRALNLGMYDYECRGAKYLIVSLFQQGLGANVHYTAIQALMAGIASNRIVLFINGANTDHHHMKKSWFAASCGRRDAQCFFAPMSPCVLSLDQIQSAGVRTITKQEKRRFFTEGRLPKEAENDKVIWLSGLQKVPNERFGGLVEQRLKNMSLTLIDRLPLDDLRRSILISAANMIAEEDPLRDGTPFFGSSSKIRHALQLYVMRPSIIATEQLDRVMGEILPTDLHPERALGMPIRASDKCEHESECLSFEQHVQAAALNLHGFARTETKPTILFTSESKEMVQAFRSFTGNKSLSMKYPFRFLTNNRDNNPDSGRVWKDEVNDADKSMLAAISSLKFQLYSATVVGNCCSNFHTLIHGFLAAGCGASKLYDFQCLQDVEDPRLRVCCWRSQGCIQSRNRDIAALLTVNNHSI